MWTRTLVLVVLASFVLAGPASAQFRRTDPMPPGEQYHVELGGILWAPKPGMVLSTDGLAAAGLPGVDFVQEFGLLRVQFREFRGILKGGKHKVRVAKVPVAYTESTRLSRPVAFGGRVFPAGANATADLQWDLWRYGYQYDFVSRSRGFLGLVAEVKHNRVRADLSASDGGALARSLSDVTAPIPTLGFAARVYPHRLLSLTAELTGMKVPGLIRKRLPDDLNVDGSFSDVDVSATLSVTRFLGIQAGYRKVSTDYVVKSDSGDLSLSGVYAGGVVRF